MPEKVIIGSSECGCDEDARRSKASSQISVLANFSEPSGNVVLDPFEKRAAATSGDRGFGDTDSGHGDVMDLYFRTPSTVYEALPDESTAARDDSDGRDA